jgi:hypothetical protein
MSTPVATDQFDTRTAEAGFAVYQAPAPDGSNYRNEVDVFGSSSQVGTVFYWIHFGETEFGTITDMFRIVSSGARQQRIWWEGTGGVLDAPGVELQNAAGATILRLNGTDPIPRKTWTAVMMSWDLATVATTNEMFVFTQEVGQAAVDRSSIVIGTNDTVQWGGVDTWFYGRFGVNFQDTKFSQVMIDTNIAIDFSVGANREAFVTAAGQPKDLGAGAITALGGTADIYLPTGDPRDFGTNTVAVTANGQKAAVFDATGPSRSDRDRIPGE